MIKWLIVRQEPEVAACAIDSPERFDAHRAVLARKPMLARVFAEFHRAFLSLDQQWLSGGGEVIELGSGVCPVRDSAPGVLATDIVASPHVDRTLDAQDMRLPPSSVRAFYLQNVLHHFPEPRKFFRELERTLVPGGGAIIIEPAAGCLARLLYPRLFASEGYDCDAAGWETAQSGPMTGANQALSHVIFDRDRALFSREFPGLRIVHRDVLGNWLRYLASGGLNFRPLVPGFAEPLLRLAERCLRPFRRQLGLHRVIVLQKSPR